MTNQQAPAPDVETILSAARNWGEVQQYNRTDGKGAEYRITFNVHQRAAHFARELLAARAPADSGAAPAGGVVAYLDVGAGGYLDLGTDLSNEALSRLPKGRHVLVIAGTYGIDGYAPAQAADSVLEDAGGANWQDISTAPKDGTRFVAVGQNYGLASEKQHTCIAQRLAGCWVEVSDWNGASKLKYLTHWMPLPPLPGSAARAPADSVLEDAARESEYRRGYRHGYNQRDAEVRGALA